MKKVKAVEPYIHPGHLNFKLAPYNIWLELSGEGGVRTSHFPPRFLHGLAFRYELPSLKWLAPNSYGLTDNVALLMFVEPVSITFDTFPYYATHEIIPFVWDCWPCYYGKMEAWLKSHNVKTAIFTSSQEMEEMRKRVPEVNYIHCPEGIDSSFYKAGKELKERSIDLLEFGRGLDFNVNDRKFSANFSKINHVRTLVGGKFLYTEEQLCDAMGHAKVTICLPRSMTHPHIAEGVETLTQRYWEAMLSRMVIVGHCPKELEDLIGYNPVIEAPLNPLDSERSTEALVLDILEHIEDYQDLVDKNREVALKKGDWKVRMDMVRKKLVELGYEVKE